MQATMPSWRWLGLERWHSSACSAAEKHQHSYWECTSRRRLSTQQVYRCQGSGVALPWCDVVVHLGQHIRYDLSDADDILSKTRDLNRKANLMSNPICYSHSYCLSLYSCALWNLSRSSESFNFWGVLCQHSLVPTTKLSYQNFASHCLLAQLFNLVIFRYVLLWLDTGVKRIAAPNKIICHWKKKAEWLPFMLPLKEALGNKD